MKAIKYKNLVHYICFKCPDPTILGATKLNKILYYSDFFYYLKYGKAITNDTYIKQSYGPVPYAILGILDDLVQPGINNYKL